MAEVERPLFEELLDVLVYAPLGALVEIVEEFPRHAATGRERLERRVNTARLTGRVAVQTARRRLESGFVPARKEVAPPEPAAPAEPTATGAAPDVASLAIPGYDALAASQVVARLAGLSPAERAEVAAYETATRGRRTILGKIAQLDGD